MIFELLAAAACSAVAYYGIAYEDACHQATGNDDLALARAGDAYEADPLLWDELIFDDEATQ